MRPEIKVASKVGGRRLVMKARRRLPHPPYHPFYVYEAYKAATFGHPSESVRGSSCLSPPSLARVEGNKK